MARKILLLISAALTLLLCSAIWGCLPEREAGTCEQRATLAPGSILAGSGTAAQFFKDPPVIVDRSDTVLALNIAAQNTESDVDFTPGTGARSYPYGTLAAALLGFRGKHGQGLYGIEYLCDTFATGEARDLASCVISPDNRLALTISKDIQLWAEKDLDRQIKRLGAESGALVMMDIRSGEILAMASGPVKNHKNAWSWPGQKFVNHTISDELDAWLFFPMIEWLRQYNSAYTVAEDDSESDNQGGASETDISGKGHEENSPSIFTRKGRKKWSWGTVSPGLVLWSPWDNEIMREFRFDPSSVRVMWQLGLGQESGLALSGEKHGSLPTMSPSGWDDMAFNTVRATPVQMLRAFSAIISSGRVVKLSVMKGQVSDKNRIEQADSAWITPESSEWIRSELALNDGPSLAAIKVEDNPRAIKEGQTKKLRDRGCAQVVSLGFWPEKNPRIAYISVLENTSHDPRVKRGTLGKTIRTARRAWSLLEQEAVPQTRLASAHPAGKKLNNCKNPAVMPDFRGMTLRRAVAAAMGSGLNPQIKGSGVVIQQQPKPGQSLGKSRECLLICSNAAGYANR